MAKVLQAVVDNGENTVKEAIWKTLSTGRVDLLWLNRHRREYLRTVAVPPALAHYSIESARAADFDHLLMGVPA